jgi:hypothetical protein
MDFRTVVEIKKESNISYSNKIMMFGSCFAENIGEKLLKSKFQTIINPFGILFNPQSVCYSLERILEKKLFSKDELFEHEGVWKSFYHHSHFIELTSETFLKNANKKLEEASDFLQVTDFLMITFGTAWIYRLKESGKVVSNCHKLPGSLFLREKLTADVVVETYTELIRQLLQVRPAMKIIFTVSPIRHQKDGMHENQLSKAVLLLAVEQLQRLFPANIIYFPAYEIVLDELRDYRFYAGDMVHPNETAIRYIWERFSGCFFSEGTKKQLSEIEKITAAAQHRPFNPQSKAFQDFTGKNLKSLSEIEKKYPNLDFKEEWTYFNRLKS